LKHLFTFFSSQKTSVITMATLKEGDQNEEDIDIEKEEE
jgi:hypothetical protein